MLTAGFHLSLLSILKGGALSELPEVAVDGVLTAVTWKPVLNTITESFLKLSKGQSGWISSVYVSLLRYLSLPPGSVLSFSLPFKFVTMKLVIFRQEAHKDVFE